MTRSKIFSALLLSSLATAACAQDSWLPAANTGRVKPDEIAARFRASTAARLATEKPDATGKIGRGKTAIREGHNYHFDRWYWHAQSHLDEDGYLVSPLKTYLEWEAYKAARRTLKTTANSSDWTFNGPTVSPGGYRGLGRITAVEFHPVDTGTFWVATAGGGAWRTTNSGAAWTNMTSGLSLLGTSDVDINPLNPQVMYLCTGDRDASDTYSMGVLKSVDGGQTWGLTGLQWTPSQNKLANELVINRLDTAKIILATSDGIFRSANGGDTWTLTFGGAFKQLVAHPTDTGVLYATGTSGATTQPQIWRSKNGGITWSRMTNLSGTSRITVAVTPAAPNMVKAVASNASSGLRAILSSHDTGASFAIIMTDSSCTKNILSWDMNLSASSCGGQGWYDLAIAVSPTDSNTVFVGGVNTWRSTNGGKAWSPVTHWVSSAPGVKTVHADKHGLRFHPLLNNTLFECNDGGIYRTSAPTVLWTDITNGMGITQFYRLAVSDTATYVVAGAQDNGTKKITFAATATDPGGGDGMNCEMDQRTPFVFYFATQYGNLNRTLDGGITSASISGTLPEGDWITPYKLHPRNQSVVVAGMDHIYSSFDRGSNWSPASTGFNGSTLFRRIALAGNDPGLTTLDSYIFTLYGSNQMRWTSDYGNVWNTLSSPGGFVSDIQVDPWDSTHLWVTFGGYVATQKVAHRFMGTSTSWTPVNTGLPNVPVHCMEIDKQNGTRYVGTDVGVFFRDTSMTAWEPYTTNLPSIEVTDIHLNYKTNQIWASTYGRGVWKSPRHIPAGPDPTGVTIVPLASGVLTVSPNPSAGHFNLRTDDRSFWNKQSVLRLYDAVGRVAWTASAAFDGSGQMAVQTSGIALGNYILEVATQAGGLARARVVVVP